MKNLSFLLVFLYCNLSLTSFCNAQQKVCISYCNNFGINNRPIRGIALSYKNSFKNNKSFSHGLSVTYWRNHIFPMSNEPFGPSVVALALDQVSLSYLLEYRFTAQKLQPYLGVEPALFLNTFNYYSRPTFISRHLGIGLIPKAGMQYHFKKLGIFLEAAYCIQSANRVDISLLRTELSFKRSYFVSQFGIFTTW